MTRCCSLHRHRWDVLTSFFFPSYFCVCVCVRGMRRQCSWFCHVAALPPVRVPLYTNVQEFIALCQYVRVVSLPSLQSSNLLALILRQSVDSLVDVSNIGCDFILCAAHTYSPWLRYAACALVTFQPPPFSLCALTTLDRIELNCSLQFFSPFSSSLLAFIAVFSRCASLFLHERFF